MYALHPGSLPPKGARETQRIEVTADDLVRLYSLQPWEYIVWDPADPDNAGLEWFDFIHLYPSYYERYTRKPDGTPEKDVPCKPISLLPGSVKTSGSSGSSAGTSMRGGPSRKC